MRQLPYDDRERGRQCLCYHIGIRPLPREESTRDDHGLRTRRSACRLGDQVRKIARVGRKDLRRGGITARNMSAFRPRIPILAITPEEKTYRQLALSHGVIPLRAAYQKDTDTLFDHAVRVAREAGYVKTGDRVVISAGLPIGKSGSTNIIKVQQVD